SENSVMRGLMALAGVIPPISVIDEVLVKRWENIQKDRFRILLSELEKGQRFLTKELIEQEDFLYAYHAVTKAAIKTRRKEKIKLLANLLLNASKKFPQSNEAFEEYLSILEDLSFRELQILLLLKQFEEGFHLQIKELESAEARKLSKESWNLFQNAVFDKCDVKGEQLIPILIRISRTGLCEVEPDYLMTDNNKEIPNMGDAYTTPRLDDFITWLQLENEES
ncbi:MAG TPA: hypothetical protein DEP36_06370, partial [Gammaproteobacteria bacterium]|nr:hypothetical protein [Gammaproteobacteria bacterium]